MIKSFLRRYRYLLFIVLGGIVLRLWQIGWGLPELYEEATPLTIAWKLWNWGGTGLDLNPHFFNYPALTFYLQFLLQGVRYLAGAAVGVYGSLRDFSTTMTPLVVGGRFLTVLFDAGIIWTVYLLAGRYADRRAAIIGALAVAVNPTHVRLSHMIQVDTPLTFFCVLALLFLQRLLSEGSRRWYILAGISIGLAAASKYTGALLIPVFIAVHLLRKKSWAAALHSLRDPSLILGLGAAVALFIATNPYILLSFDEFYRDFSFEEHHVSYGHLGVNPGHSTLGYYFLNILPSSFGWPFAIALVAALMFLIRRRDRSMVLLLFPVIYIFVISTWTMRAERYIFPIIPLLIIAGVVGMVQAWDFAVGRGRDKGIARPLQSRQVRRAAGTIVVLLLLAAPFVASLNYLHSLGLPDTRFAAKEWIKAHLKPGAAIASGPYGVEFPDSSYSMLHIPFIAFETERVLPFYDARWYEDLDLLIASDFDYGRFAAEPDRYAGFLQYYESLRTRWHLEREFAPGSSSSGPTIWFFTYPDSLRKTRFDSTLFDRLSAEPESSRVSVFLKSLEAILYKKGRLEKCRQILENIVSVEVTNLDARNHLAQVLYDLNDDDACLRQLQISVRQNPSQPRAFALAGSALRRINRPREAEAVLLKALELDRRMESSYVELRELYRGEHDLKKLRGILSRYLAVLPKGSARAQEISRELDSLNRP